MLLEEDIHEQINICSYRKDKLEIFIVDSQSEKIPSERGVESVLTAEVRTG